jgi:ubiquinone/menaquinone biosynthesis C-methylase UbiE
VRVAQIVGPEGVADVLDVHPGMLDATRHQAQRRRLHNLVTSNADASGRFPSPDATFDAAPDEPQQTLAEEE